jgi:Flp pilus assembly pilin Flp
MANERQTLSDTKQFQLGKKPMSTKLEDSVAAPVGEFSMTKPTAVRRSLKRRLHQAGQGMSEYILIIGLVALLVYAAVQLFGKDIQGLFNKANNDLSQVESSAT